MTETTMEEAINKAINSKLATPKKTPRWFNSIKSDASRVKEYRSKAEMIDAINTPEGELAVIWIDKSYLDKDRYPIVDSGINISRLEMREIETGNIVAYISIQHSNNESQELSFGKDWLTPLRWKVRFSGYSAKIPASGKRLNAKEMKEMWRSFVTYNAITVKYEGKIIPAYQVTDKHYPDDKQIEEDLKTLSEKYIPEMEEHKEFFSVPFIDFARVEGKYLGKGYGQLAYIYAAKKIGESRQMLRASDLQSGDAQKAWRGLNRNAGKYVSSVSLTYEGQRKTYPCLKMF